MKYSQIEDLNNALSDQSILLKNLEFDDYISFMRLKKELGDIVEKQQTLISNLIEEYNKPFTEKRKSEDFKKALNKEPKDRSSEDIALLSEQPPVKTTKEGFIQGPVEFIEKFNKLRNQSINVNTKILKDKKAFKATFENVSVGRQSLLFEHLLK